MNDETFHGIKTDTEFFYDVVCDSLQLRLWNSYISTDFQNQAINIWWRRREWMQIKLAYFY